MIGCAAARRACGAARGRRQGLGRLRRDDRPAVDWGQPELMLRPRRSRARRRRRCARLRPGSRYRRRAPRTLVARAIARPCRSCSTPMRSTLIAADPDACRSRRRAPRADARDAASGRGGARCSRKSRRRCAGATGSRPHWRLPTMLHAAVVLKGAGSVLALSGRHVGHQRQRQPGARHRGHRRRARRVRRRVPRAGHRSGDVAAPRRMPARRRRRRVRRARTRSRSDSRRASSRPSRATLLNAAR